MSNYPDDMADTGCGAEPPYGRDYGCDLLPRSECCEDCLEHDVREEAAGCINDRRLCLHCMAAEVADGLYGYGAGKNRLLAKLGVLLSRSAGVATGKFGLAATEATCESTK